MKIVKLFLYGIVVIGAILSFNTSISSPYSTVFAQNGIKDACDEAPNNPYCRENRPGNNSLLNTIKKITTFIAYLGGVVAVIVIIYGGFRYVVSSGNEQKVATAKDTILYGVVGLVVIVAAQSIVLFILSLLT